MTRIDVLKYVGPAVLVSATMACSSLNSSPAPVDIHGTVDASVATAMNAQSLALTRAVLPSATSTPSPTKGPDLGATLNSLQSTLAESGRAYTPIAVVSSTPNPSATPTFSPTFSATATGTARPLGATRTVVPDRTPSGTPGLARSSEQTPSGSSITLKGVPDKVNQSDLHINTNNGPDADGVDHKNTVGFGTEIFIGEPGTLVVQDPNMVGPSASLLGPDVQSSFNTVGPSIVQNPEGGALTSSLGYGKIEFTLIDGTAVTLDLPAIPDNVYLVDIKNDNRDGSTPKDGNSDVVFSGYHAGNTIATKYPPGQMISEGHFKQNVASGHTATLSTNAPGNACGADGCKKVTAIFIDRNTGAFTIIEQTELNGPWKLVQSNIK